jgi:hypothetical protein
LRARAASRKLLILEPSMNLAVRFHTLLAAVVAFALGTLVPVLALACPGSGGAGAHGACGSCGGSGLGTATAVSIGLLVGLGSVVLESVLRRRRE